VRAAIAGQHAWLQRRVGDDEPLLHRNLLREDGQWQRSMTARCTRLR
jgi:hypothetical protein